MRPVLLGRTDRENSKVHSCRNDLADLPAGHEIPTSRHRTLPSGNNPQLGPIRLTPCASPAITQPSEEDLAHLQKSCPQIVFETYGCCYDQSIEMRRNEQRCLDRVDWLEQSAFDA